MHPAYIFLICLGAALSILAIIYTVAMKYMRGDYIRVPRDHKEIEKNEENTTNDVTIPISDDDCHLSSDTDDECDGLLSNDGTNIAQSPNKSGLPHGISAKVKFTLKYQTKTKSLFGCIRKVEGFDRLTKHGVTYDRLYFHLKFVSAEWVHKARTKWKSTEESHKLHLTFNLGPLDLHKAEKDRTDDDTDNTDILDTWEDISDSGQETLDERVQESSESRLCMRVYGLKKSVFFRAKCLGETFVDLDSVVEKQNTAVKMVETLTPIPVAESNF